jgi:hypothetical protein
MHVLCAVAMYWFWWDKPLDVRYPIILDLEQHVAEEIYSSYRVRDDGRSLPPQPRPGTPPNNGNSPPGDSVQGTEDTRQDALEGNTSRKSTTLDGAQAARTNANAATYSYRSHPTRLQNNRFRERFLREYFLQGLHDVHLWAVVLLSPIIILSQYVWWHQTFELWPSIGEDLTDLEVRLIKLARLRERGDVAQPFKQSPVMLGRPADRKLKPLCVRARMIQQTGLLRGYSKGHGLVSLEAFLVLACLSVLYGGAHAGAWNTHLPSTVERLLWRVSSVIAGTFVPLTLASLYVGVLIDMYITELDEWVKLQSPWWHSKNNRFTNWFVKQSVDHALVVLAATYVIPGVFAFIFARSFLVVESFISLRSLPKGSFKTVPWSNYWPHF